MNVLVVDDEIAMCDVICEDLARRGFQTVARTEADDAFRLLSERDFDAVVTDLNMRGMNGIELCERVATNRPDVPVIIVTAFGSMETAIATLRAGAYDFLTKPFDTDQLVMALEKAQRHRELRREVKRLQRALAETQHFDDLLGASAVMRALYDMVARVAATETTVLLTGESGTGKDLVARAVHRRSRRANGPLVAINCAAVPDALLEAELFGHARGAFTDAKTERRGLFVDANGGTLFLDELGEMSLAMQAKLLRAIESRSVRPIGRESEVPVDVRVVAATNRDLRTAIEEGRFREDLYYRINVVQLDVPPLRVRGRDVLLLAQAFLERFATEVAKPVARLSPSAAERLLSYAWPGNVRELRNCIERAVALARYDEIVVEDLPPNIRDYRPSHVVVAASGVEELVPLADVEKRYIERVLEAVEGNKRRAARILGLDRTTLYRKLERYGLASGEG